MSFMNPLDVACSLLFEASPSTRMPRTGSQFCWLTGIWPPNYLDYCWSRHHTQCKIDESSKLRHHPQIWASISMKLHRIVSEFSELNTRKEITIFFIDVCILYYCVLRHHPQSKCNFLSWTPSNRIAFFWLNIRNINNDYLDYWFLRHHRPVRPRRPGNTNCS